MIGVILPFIIMFLSLEDLLLASVMMLCIFISINILLLLLFYYYYYYYYYYMLLYNVLHLFIFSSSWIASAMWSHGSSSRSEGILLYLISF